MLNHQALAFAAPLVLRAWGLEAQSISRVRGGTLNFNFDVQTGSGRFFLRCYRPDLETSRIVGEHRLVQWLADRAIPTSLPVEASSGEVLLTHEESRWALFKWVDGRSVERGRLSAPQARALGAMHGRIQETLARHPQSAGARFGQRWDRDRSLGLLGELVETARTRELAPWLIAGIERQRQLLQSSEVLPPEHFSALPCQLLHGDFHDEQVLFGRDRDEVAAVVDWEIWHTDARAWELVRALSFSLLLDSPRLDDYLEGYGEHARLAESEIQLALTLWFQSRIVGVWAWWAFVMDGNERVERFFPAMLTELGHISEPAWRESVRTRVVRGAVG